MKYVGQSVPRSDAVTKVTGSLEYAIDSRIAGMLHARLLRSEFAHARLLRINVADAHARAGVVGIFTAEDLPQPVPRFGPVIADQPLLACGQVKHYGEPVAVVLAENPNIAAEAVRRIRVEYEELPAVCTVADALEPGAPVVHPGTGCDRPESNQRGEWHFQWGDVDKARAECAHMVENSYRYPMVYHHALEPLSCIAYPQDGGVVIKSCVQHPFILQRVVSSCLGLDLSKVRVIATPIGGGFGGKGYPKLEPLAAYLALHTGRAVQLSTSFADGFLAMRRLSARVSMKTGFDRRGQIVFQDVAADYLMGAYADAATRIAQKAGFLACGPYRTPNARIAARAIYSNTVPGTACRGFGMPQLVWAIESQMNAAAALLGIDALEIRLRNLPAKGEELVPGDTAVDGEWADDLRQTAAMIGWNKHKETNTGRGIAIGIKNPIQASISNAMVKLHADKTVTLIVGTTEMGQGAQTVMAQIAAEALALPMERIKVILGDTELVGFDTATAGSRSTVTMGNAVLAACHDLLDQLHNKAQKAGLAGPGETLSLVSLMDRLSSFLGTDEPTGRGTFTGKKDPSHALGGLTDFWEVVFTAAEVKVNPDTGQISVTKLSHVSEVGQAINPSQAEAQEEGGVVMGLGHALMEELLYDEQGRLANGNPAQYLVPTVMDVPAELETCLVENQDGPGPFGAKGIGEGGVIAVAPAIAGAVHDAIGVLCKDLPLTAEKVWGLFARGRT